LSVPNRALYRAEPRPVKRNPHHNRPVTVLSKTFRKSPDLLHSRSFYLPRLTVCEARRRLFCAALGLNLYHGFEGAGIITQGALIDGKEKQTVACSRKFN